MGPEKPTVTVTAGRWWWWGSRIEGRVMVLCVCHPGVATWVNSSRAASSCRTCPTTTSPATTSCLRSSAPLKRSSRCGAFRWSGYKQGEWGLGFIPLNRANILLADERSDETELSCGTLRCGLERAVELWRAERLQPRTETLRSDTGPLQAYPHLPHLPPAPHPAQAKLEATTHELSAEKLRSDAHPCAHVPTPQPVSSPAPHPAQAKLEATTHELRAEKLRSDALVQRMSVLLSCFPTPEERAEKKSAAAAAAAGAAAPAAGAGSVSSRRRGGPQAPGTGGWLSSGSNLIDGALASGGSDVDHVEVIEAVRRSISQHPVGTQGVEDIELRQLLSEVWTRACVEWEPGVRGGAGARALWFVERAEERGCVYNE
eukprot:352706-Chlamydomonas_euryale.AAC.1